MARLRFSLTPKSSLISFIAILLAVPLGTSAPVVAQGLTLIASTSFTESTLIPDAAGNLYGVTQAGGTSQNCKNGCGTVFEVSPVTSGGWSVTTLYNFSGRFDGWSPVGGLVFDSTGNLYGTTQSGGGSKVCVGGCGTVFELSPSSNGNWTETILHRFTGLNDGAFPLASLIFDPAGNLYGTASFGGVSQGGGVVFKLSRANGLWKESVLYNFLGSADGQYPSSSLLLDSAGNLYGTTFSGGIQSSGSVFMLSPSSGGWKETVLHDFTGGADGYQPAGNLTFDKSGRIYGTTTYGGNKKGGAGFGVVYGLSRNSQGQWKETVLHSFEGGVDGANPSSGVTFDRHGNLYGTTEGPYTGCTIGACGQVFQLIDTLGTWKIQNVYPLPSGLTSLGGLTRAAKNNLFFTASDFQTVDEGSVYELTP